VLLAGAAMLLLAIMIGGMREEYRIAGSNGIDDGEFVAVLEPRRVLCQAGQDVPEGTGFLRMTIGTYGRPGPALRTSLQAGDRALLPVGELAAGWTQGVVDLPLGRDAPQRLSDVRVCIANRGPHRLAVAGRRLQPQVAARVAGTPERGRVRIEYVSGERRSAWSLAGSMTSRMAFGRGLWDGAAPWVALALVLLAGAGSGRALLRARRDDRPRESR